MFLQCTLLNFVNYVFVISYCNKPSSLKGLIKYRPMSDLICLIFIPIWIKLEFANSYLPNLKTSIINIKRQSFSVMLQRGTVSQSRKHWLTQRAWCNSTKMLSLVESILDVTERNLFSPVWIWNFLKDPGLICCFA